MPNTGKPSQDCHLCRARRVKCDLARPWCLRCSKYGARCPGYRDAVDLAFRHGNLISVEQQHRKKQKAASSSQPTAKLQQSRTGADSLPLQLCPPLQLSYLQRNPSGALLADLFSETSSTPGRLGFVSDLLHETRETSCLASVADLFSELLRNQKFRDRMTNTGTLPTQSSMAAQEHYGVSLTSIRSALEHPSRRLKDETLAAMWLLSLCEVVSGLPDRGGAAQSALVVLPGAWHIHSEGIREVLRARGKAQFATDQGRRLFWVGFNIIQLRCLASQAEFPAEAEGWLSALRNSPSPAERIRVVISDYVMQACAILSVMERLVCCSRPEEACSAVAGVLESIALLELTGRPSSDDLLVEAQPRVQMDNMHRSARLKLHAWTLLLVDFILNHAKRSPALESRHDLQALRPQRLASREIVETVANDILGSTEATLGTTSDHVAGRGRGGRLQGTWVNGMRMTTPLQLVSALGSLLPNHARIASLYLDRIAEQMGINEARKRYYVRLQTTPEARLD